MTQELQFNDELTIDRADELLSALQAVLRNRQTVVVNLTNASRIDTAIAQLLLAARQEAVRTGTSIRFDCSSVVSEHLHEIGIRL